MPRARQYSCEELIKHLKKLELKLGRLPREKDVAENYNKDSRTSLKAYLNEFGTFGKARKSAHLSSTPWQKFSKSIPPSIKPKLFAGLTTVSTDKSKIEP